MNNYIAYTLGGSKAYPVTQMKKDGDDTYIVFNGRWQNVNGCFLWMGSGIKDCQGLEIFDGDILQLVSTDNSSPYQNGIGVVKFERGKFIWLLDGQYGTHELIGKSWRKIGNVASDIDKFFTAQKIEQSYFLKSIKAKNEGYYNGVMIEKYFHNDYVNKKNLQKLSQEPINKDHRKYEKKLLHQYKNYLTIKSLLEKGDIDKEIIEENYKTLCLNI